MTFHSSIRPDCRRRDRSSHIKITLFVCLFDCLFAVNKSFFFTKILLAVRRLFSSSHTHISKSSHLVATDLPSYLVLRKVPHYVSSSSFFVLENSNIFFHSLFLWSRTLFLFPCIFTLMIFVLTNTLNKFIRFDWTTGTVLVQYWFDFLTFNLM